MQSHRCPPRSKVSSATIYGVRRRGACIWHSSGAWHARVFESHRWDPHRHQAAIIQLNGLHQQKGETSCSSCVWLPVPLHCWRCQVASQYTWHPGVCSLKANRVFSKRICPHIEETDSWGWRTYTHISVGWRSLPIAAIFDEGIFKWWLHTTRTILWIMFV